MGNSHFNEDFAFSDARRPLRDLVLLLPHLQVRPGLNVDYESAEPAMLFQIGTNAEITMRTIHRGTAAIGRLLVHVSPELGTGEISADSVEALGWLICEISDLAAVAHCIATSCRRYTADYSPETPKTVPNTRP